MHLSNIFQPSDKRTKSAKNGTSCTNRTEASKTLLERHNSLFVQVSVVLDFTVDHVGCESLNSDVGLVLPKTVGSLTHPEVGPASVSCTMQSLVVVDSGKSLLQDRSVEKGVKSVTGHAEGIDLARNYTLVLLGRQVL